MALALLGIIGMSFLGATATTSNSWLSADEHVSTRILAESQMEVIKQQDYASSYNTTIPSQYVGYSTEVDIDNLRSETVTGRTAHFVIRNN